MSFIKKQFGSGGFGAGRGARNSVGRNIIEGDAELQRIFGYLRQTAARRITTTGAAEAAKQLAKNVKASVPSRFKGARRAIGWRRLKVKEAPEGGAKIGGRVGRSSRAYVGKRAAKRASNRKGVGIGAQNIHWLFQDVEHNPRWTGKRRGPVRYTGVMLSRTNGIPSVSVTAQKSIGELKALFAQGARKQLTKEIAKGKAFA